MEWKLLVAALLTLTLLSGCVDGGDATDDAALTVEDPAPPGATDAEPQAKSPPPAADPAVRLEGVVQDGSFAPIAGATVRIVDLDLRITTAADGGFRFTDIPLRTFLLNVTAEGFEPWSQIIRTQEETTVTLTVELTDAAPVPYHVSVPHQGSYECAFELLIIPGSCGRLLSDFTPQPDPFQSQSSFDHAVQDAWHTIIVDVSWDGDLPPTLAALRLSVYNWNGSNELGEYERLARVWDDEPFTLRLDAGETYEAVPTPTGAGQLLFEVFPQGHGYNEVCDPDGTCFLGVGAATDLRFEVVITTFYHGPAPDGWTIADA